MIDKM